MVEIKAVARRAGRARWTGLAVAACFIGSIVTAQAAPAQNAYPNKPIRVVVAFGPGGVADIVARLVGKKLNEHFAQSVVVDNRPGAGGIVASKLVAGAAPDGYTLLVITGAVAINAVTSSEGVDPRSQLTPIALAASAPTLFATHRATTAKNMMDLVRNVKARRFTYATAGAGTAEHLTADYIFKLEKDLEAVHVPFGGGGAAITAALGQQVDIVSTPLPSASTFIKDGRLKVLAVASHKRLSALPDVPTLRESGFADLENMTWVAYFGPAKLAADLTNTLNGAINNALRDAEVSERLSSLGFTRHIGSGAEFATYVRTEFTKWDQIVKKTGNPLK